MIAAGYGDISSERAYLRTEACPACAPTAPRWSEDPGQRLWRGRQGRHARAPGHQAGPDARQCAAGRRGQRHRPGPATSSTEYSTSALGTVASASGAEAYRAGLGSGVGKALDRLAQYYIKLAENTFPVIEGGCRPRSRRGDHQGRAHRRPHDGGRPVFRAPRPLPELP